MMVARRDRRAFIGFGGGGQSCCDAASMRLITWARIRSGSYPARRQTEAKSRFGRVSQFLALVDLVIPQSVFAERRHRIINGLRNNCAPQLSIGAQRSLLGRPSPASAFWSCDSAGRGAAQLSAPPEQRAVSFVRLYVIDHAGGLPQRWPDTISISQWGMVCQEAGAGPSARRCP